MFIECYKKALTAMKRYGLLILGISVLSTVICSVADSYDGGISALSIAFGLLVIAGVCKVFLDANDGKQISTEAVFDGFSLKKLPKVLGGMAWGAFWAHIWLTIPKLIIEGIFYLFNKAEIKDILYNSLMQKPLDFDNWEYVFEYAKWTDSLAVAIISLILAILIGGAVYVFTFYKLYSYRFLPYILVTKDEIKATDALKLSKQMTNGKKLGLFVADMIWFVPVAVLVFVFGLIGDINSVTDKIFTILNFIIKTGAYVFVPLFAGLYSAAFFTTKKSAPAQNSGFQSFQNFQNFNNTTNVNQ